MKRSAIPQVSALRASFERRRNSLLLRAPQEQFLSLAGLVGRPVTNPADEHVGILLDVVSRWDGAEIYPAVIGLVVRVGRRRAFIEAAAVAALDPEGVRLESARVDLLDFTARQGEVLLALDVLDHEVVDMYGAKVVRASDLYLAAIDGVYRLVGLDVSMATVLRRVGPARWRAKATPSQVIDWADVHAFGQKGRGLRLGAAVRELPRLRAADLAALLERLRRSEREDLLDVVDRELAADALEEMGAEQLTSLLSDMPPERAAELLSHMEPDEAAEALREVDGRCRDELLAAMPVDTARDLTGLLVFDQTEAGGFMTTSIMLATASETVRSVRMRISDFVKEHGELDAIIVVDADGRLVDDITIVELFLGELDARLEEFIGPPWPITVTPEASDDEVAERIIANRYSSVVVVDMEGRPLGRVFADDILDSITRQSERWRMPRRR